MADYAEQTKQGKEELVARRTVESSVGYLGIMLQNATRTCLSKRKQVIGGYKWKGIKEFWLQAWLDPGSHLLCHFQPVSSCLSSVSTVSWSQFFSVVHSLLPCNQGGKIWPPTV